MKKFLFIIGLVVLALIGFFLTKDSEQTTTDDNSALHEASLQYSWIANGSVAGDVVGAVQFAKDYNLDLDFDFGGPGINPMQLVLSGEKTFGWASADEVLAANEKGADLAIVGVINDVNPTAFASLPESNITTLKDFEGKKVGVLPFGGTTMFYEIILKKNNIDRSTISEITISGDLKPFLAGKYDVQPVFVNDEMVTLDMKGVDYNVIMPENYGAGDIKGYVYFTKRSTVEDNPELVQAFVNTMADGWNYAIENPAESINILKSFAPEIDAERETKVLEATVPYMTRYNDQPINSDPSYGWQTMVDELKEVGVLENDVDFGKVLRFEFINNYYGQ